MRVTVERRQRRSPWFGVVEWIFGGFELATGNVPSVAGGAEVETCIVLVREDGARHRLFPCEKHEAEEKRLRIEGELATSSAAEIADRYGVPPAFLDESEGSAFRDAGDEAWENWSAGGGVPPTS